MIFSSLDKLANKDEETKQPVKKTSGMTFTSLSKLKTTKKEKTGQQASELLAKISEQNPRTQGNITIPPNKKESFLTKYLGVGKPGLGLVGETFKKAVENPKNKVKTGMSTPDNEFAKSLKGGGVSNLQSWGGSMVQLMPKMQEKVFKSNPIEQSKKFITDIESKIASLFGMENPFYDPQDKVWQDIKKAGDDIGNKIKQDSQQRLLDHPEWNAPEYYKVDTAANIYKTATQHPIEFISRIAGEQGPTMAAQMLSAIVLGGEASIVLMTAGSGGETYDKAKEKGLSDEDATNKALIRGLIEAKLENIGIEKLLKIPSSGKLVGTFVDKLLGQIKKVGIPVLTEATTEGLQELQANAVAMTFDEDAKLWDNVLMSAIGGAVLGGGVSTFMSTITPEDRLLTREEKKQANQKIQQIDSELAKISEQPESVDKADMTAVLNLQKEKLQSDIKRKLSDKTPEEILGRQPRNLIEEQIAEPVTEPVAEQAIEPTAEPMTEQVAEQPVQTEAEIKRQKAIDYIKQKSPDKFRVEEEPLAVEAKKYKSAEDFVRSQKAIYHGTPEKFSKFDTSRSEGNATWFTADKKDIIDNTAGAVQGPGQKLNIMERYVKPGLKLATPEMADKMYTDQLVAEGYKGIKYPKGEYGDYEWTKLFDPNKDTITKSQLTDIWNKAQKAPQTLQNAPGEAISPKTVESTTPAKEALKTPEKEVSKKVVQVTETKEKIAERKPIQKTTGEQKKSRAYQRIAERLKEDLPEPVYNEMNIAENTARALNLVEQDYEKSIRIAKGLDAPPPGVGEFAIAIATSEEAGRRGDYKIQAQIEKSLSLRATRAGQEIVSLKGRIDDNSPSTFIKLVMDARMKEINKTKYEWIKNKLKMNKTNKLQDLSMDLKEKVKQDMGKISKAQSLIDMLTC
jgi:hypothetical protein